MQERFYLLRNVSYVAYVNRVAVSSLSSVDYYIRRQNLRKGTKNTQNYRNVVILTFKSKCFSPKIVHVVAKRFGIELPG